MNHFRIVGLTCWLFFLLPLATQVGSTATGQQVVIRRGQAIAAPGFGGVDAINDMKAQFEDSLKLQKVAMEQRMSVRLDDLGHICDLTPDQLQKLQIAAKGAIEKTMSDSRKAMEDSLQQMGGPQNADEAMDDTNEDVIDEAPEGGIEEADEAKVPEANSEPNEAEAADEPPVDADAQPDAVVDLKINVQPMIGLALAQPFFGPSTDGLQPEMQAIWKSTVEKTLTSGQSAKLADVMAERTKQQSTAAVENFIAKADVEIFLQPAQREKLTAWVQQNYGELLHSKLGNPAFGFMAMGNDFDTRANPEVEAILRPAQLSIWNSKFFPELEMLKNMVDGPAGGVIRFNRN